MTSSKFKYVFLVLGCIYLIDGLLTLFYTSNKHYFFLDFLYQKAKSLLGSLLWHLFYSFLTGDKLKNEKNYLSYHSNIGNSNSISLAYYSSSNIIIFQRRSTFCARKYTAYGSSKR